MRNNKKRNQQEGKTGAWKTSFKGNKAEDIGKYEAEVQIRSVLAHESIYLE